MIAELTVTPPEQAELFRRFMETAKSEAELEGKQKTLTEYIPETTFTLPKALVSLVGVIACGVVVERGLLPPISLLCVVGAVLAFAFAPQLKELVQGFLEKKPPAEEEEELRLEDIEKISGLFSQIRQKYVAAYFLIRWQGAPEEPIPEAFEGLGLPKELVNRGEYLKHTLPHEFMDVIGRIVNACEKSIWQRKQLIVSAMVQSSMAAMARR